MSVKVMEENIVNIMNNNSELFKDEMILDRPSNNVRFYAKVNSVKWEEVTTKDIIVVGVKHTTPDGLSEMDNWRKFRLSFEYNFNNKLVSVDGYTFSRTFDTREQEEESIYNGILSMMMRKKCPIKLFKDLPESILDTFYKKKYYSKMYSDTELMEIYEIIEDDRILPSAAKDVFLF